MKRIIKFIPVALTAVALSSCSSDDLFGSQSSKTDGLKTLEVTVEQLNDGEITRCANVGDGNSVVWQAGDEISVYDDKLFIYDPYTFDATAKSFLLKKDEQELLDAPQFAIFPTAYFGEGSTSWERKTDRVFVTATIPYGMQYGLGETPYVDNGGKAAYVSLLPMWGTASKSGDKTAVSLKYMTAILKVTLTNAQDNVKYLYVRGFKDIAGTKPAQLWGPFKAYLSETGRTPAASAVLEPTLSDTELAVGGLNVLQIDIRSINKATSVIYIPIPAGHYGMLDVWADNTDRVMTGDASAADVYAYTADEKIYQFIDKDFDVKFYGSLTKREYDVEGGTIAAINNLLAANKDEAKDNLVLNCADGSATAATDDSYKITLPNMAAGTVELKLAGVTGHDIEVIGSEFSKKFILNLKTTNQAVTIDLPNADVVLAGDFNNKSVTVLNAKSLTFGDGAAAPAPATSITGAINIKAEVNGDVTVAQRATVSNIELPANHRTESVVINGTAGNITINASEHLSNVTVAGTAGAISTPNDASAVTVSGTAGVITMAGSGKVTITGHTTGNVANKAGGVEISGAPYFDITANKYAKVEGNVTTTGDVTINLSGEGAAINGTLTTAKGKTITLTQGYVKSITGAGDQANAFTVDLGNDTKYKTLVFTGKVTVTGTTQWNGKAIGGSLTNGTIDANGTELKAAGVTEVTGAWADYKDVATAVYTATGLAMNKTTFTLMNNINLNNQDWTPVAAAGNINGNGKTISNIKVKQPTEAAEVNAGRGFFTDLGDNTVQNLKLQTVVVNANRYAKSGTNYVPLNIGGLAGKAGAATVKLVTIDDLTINCDNASTNIGGFIGTNTDALTLSGCQLTGSNTIKGYYNVGGMLGYAANNVTINTLAKGAIASNIPAAATKSTAAFGYEACYNSGKDNDPLYLKVGDLVGSFDGDNAVVTIEADALVATGFTKTNSVFSGVSKFAEIVEEQVKYYDYVFPQNLIGFATSAAVTKKPSLKIGSAAAVGYVNYLTKATADAHANGPVLYYINK